MEARTLAAGVAGADTVAVGAWPVEQPASNKLTRNSPITIIFVFILKSPIVSCANICLAMLITLTGTAWARNRRVLLEGGLQAVQQGGLFSCC